ncbi:TonB-dependent receptor [Yeosuana sp. MJ-SS3]|uniref:TonB-dependent receptor n=1 Tax=Gilvirhabdus luticola TaxID=3079858 RepID=A0ABU3U815_9FLAO|nr:TonB-dependent receptor [Yeosuana sp. MJ-SS3]MDU8886535.1 TonB-dependent receptor [Yeosuana sp. MJ-SS3]
MKFVFKTIFVIIMITTDGVNAQEVYKGKVVDIESGIALPNVSITSTEDNQTYLSNLQGEFIVPNPENYVLKKSGYIDIIIQIDKNYQIIQLSSNPLELNEVIINSDQIPKQLKKSVATVNLLSSADIQRGNSTDIAPTLNRTSGVFMQSGALNTNRITIRGIGSRNLFGTAKIRAYYKDIPLTNGSGETNIEDFELMNFSRVEIDKGASSIYGAGLGGTIHLIPQNAYLKQTNINSEFSFGSFGFTKGFINFNIGAPKRSFRGIYSNTNSDGYRKNNEYKRQTFNFNSNFYLGENNDLTFLMSYVDLFAYIPSSLNESSYKNNPSSAAFTWAQSKGYEDSKRGIFGIAWNHKYSTNLKQITSIFTSFRNAYEPRPFDILDENLLAIGMRSRIIGNTILFDNDLNWTLGTELFNDNYKYSTFENLYEDFPAGTGSVKGNQLTNFKEKRAHVNVFLETNYNLTKSTVFSIGINYNQTSYKLNEKFVISPNDPDQSGSFKFKGIVSPKFGISQEVSKNSVIYANASHGFSPITLSETLMPNGQINRDLKPETGWNIEVGTRGSIVHNRLFFNMAIYRMDIKNLLVSRRIAEDEYIGINAGKTQHDGLEVSLQYNIVNKGFFTLGSLINYTFNDYIFKEFIDEDNNFSGNELTGVPKDVFNAVIDFDSKIGLYGNVNFQYIGSMPITDGNSLYSNSYKLTNFKLGYKFNIYKQIKANLFYGLNNIFDEKYASQILINANSFNGSAPRYYYPGNPINYYAGFNVIYNF